MPNQDLRGLLNAPVTLIKSIETSLPVGAPQISATLASVVASLPALPTLPAGVPTFPALPASIPILGLQAPPNVTEFIRSVQGALPAGLPQLAGVGGSAIGIETKPTLPTRQTIGI